MKTYMSIGKQWVLRIGIFLLILLLLADLGMIFVLAEKNGYTLTREETQLYWFQSITESKCYDIMHEWEQYAEIGSDYRLSPDYRGKTHFRFLITSPEGEVLYTNHPTGISQAVPGDVWLKTAHTMPVYEWSEENNGHKWTDRYPYYGNPENNLDTHAYTIQGFYSFSSATFDIYDMAELLLSAFHPMRYFLPAVLLIGVIFLAILLGQLTRHTGHRQYLPDHPLYRGEVVLTFSDRIPYDLYLFAALCLFTFICVLFEQLYNLVELNMLYLAIWLALVLMMCLITLVLAAYITTVTRIKAHTLFKNTLVWRFCLLIRKLWLRFWHIIGLPFAELKKLVSAIPLIWQAAVIAPVVLLLYGLLSSVMWESAFLFLIWLVVSAALILVLLYGAYCFRLLMQAGGALADGNLRYKTDTKYLLSIFRSHGENLNRIGDGMEKALAEKLKSERFKTELITNVSHDIKTPLTSIINYTDLLSREPLEGKAKEYTEVLSRQSARLKKLIEDLIEASKASTGNIAVSPERLDICQIVRQSLGEYAERMENHHLQVVQTLPPEEIYAMVDGRQLWRVLDNLYSNVCKYALEGTRVYVVAAEDEGEVTISVKNISRDVLTTAADELTERFVQGDASRSSEGSGLGLNIAKSLTELQNGRFRIHCDGDLFRCDISFPVIP